MYIAGRNISFFNPFPTQYPKAKYHLLLMRRKCNEHLGDMSRVRNLDYLEPSHLDELREFHALGRAIASRLVDRPRVDDDDADGTTSAAANGGPPPPTTMKLGYHALPSFEPLHLHIISSDLDSTCVTKRNHVTSFVSPLFFVSPTAVERHLESAFANDVAVSVRRERARNVLDGSPMTCVRGCGLVAGSVPDWKRHNRLCDIPPMTEEKKGESGRRALLNSLLGWRRKAGGAEPRDREAARSRRPTCDSGYIVPMTPAQFTIGESKTRYLIYMAIRERRESAFARGLARCDDACSDELRHCLQLEGTRHVTMYDGYLSVDQVRGLDFRGRFDRPLVIELDGWKYWEAGAYLGVSGKSVGDLRRLLNEVDGLPRHREKKEEEEKCDHLSLYRRRGGEMRMPYGEMKQEFGKMRAATESHNWGSVEGMSIRIKAHGGPYSDCRILADATTCIGPSPKKAKAATEPRPVLPK